MTLSPTALKFLAWIRDNEHHESGWVEANGEFPLHPDNWEHIRVRGDRGSIKVNKEVAAEACEYFHMVHGDEFRETKRMYRPNDAGLKALEEAGV